MQLKYSTHVVRLQALERRTRTCHVSDELRARAVYPERAHARHGKHVAPEVDLTQQLHERGRRGKAELECAHVRREMDEAGLVELVGEGTAGVVQRDAAQGRRERCVAG